MIPLLYPSIWFDQSNKLDHWKSKINISQIRNRLGANNVQTKKCKSDFWLFQLSIKLSHRWLFLAYFFLSSFCSNTKKRIKKMQSKPFNLSKRYKAYAEERKETAQFTFHQPWIWRFDQDTMNKSRNNCRLEKYNDAAMSPKQKRK